MKVLIVHTHYETKSFFSALKDLAVKALGDFDERLYPKK